MSSIAIPPIGGGSGGGKPKYYDSYGALVAASVGDNTLAFVADVSGDSRCYNTSGWGFYKYDDDDSMWVLLAQQNNIAGEAGFDGNVVEWLSGFLVDSGIAKSNIALLNTDNSFTGDIEILGSLTVAGSATFIHTDHLLVEDNTITVNDGETGSGVTSITAGLEVDRGTENPYFMLFDENSDSFKIGEADSLQKVATREDSPTLQGIASWDSTTEKFVTVAENVITKNLIPLTADTYSLGTSAYPYKDLYVSGSSIYVGNKKIEVSGGELLLDGVSISEMDEWEITAGKISPKAGTAPDGIEISTSVENLVVEGDDSTGDWDTSTKGANIQYTDSAWKNIREVTSTNLALSGTAFLGLSTGTASELNDGITTSDNGLGYGSGGGGIDLGSAVIINRSIIYIHFNGGSGYNRGVRVDGSNDANFTTTAILGYVEVVGNIAGTRTINFLENTTAYRYYRYYLYLGTSGSYTYTINEMELYGGEFATTDNTITSNEILDGSKDIAPGSLAVVDGNDNAVTLSNKLNIAYDTGSGMSSFIDLTAFKALSSSLFAGISSLKLKIQPIDDTSVKSLTINNTSTALDLKSNAVVLNANSVEFGRLSSDGTTTFVNQDHDDRITDLEYITGVVNISAGSGTIDQDADFQKCFINVTDSDITINVVDATTVSGKEYLFKNTTGTYNTLLTAISGQTIEDSSAYIISGAGEKVWIASDGSNWWTV